MYKSSLPFSPGSYREFICLFKPSRYECFVTFRNKASLVPWLLTLGLCTNIVVGTQVTLGGTAHITLTLSLDYSIQNVIKTYTLFHPIWCCCLSCIRPIEVATITLADTLMDILSALITLKVSALVRAVVSTRSCEKVFP